MSDTQTATTGRPQPSGTAAPVWWIICSRELRDLWIGGKALQLILFYTVLLGVYAFFLASNAEVNLLPVREMIQEVAKAAIVGCLLMSMIVGADSVAGDRERGTFEGLLLTPAKRTQIVFGKYVAAISPIPVALLITIPYVAVLCKGNPVFWPTVLWLAVLAGLLVPALAAMGLLTSIWSNSTKVSMAVTFALFLLMLLPSEIMRPGKVMTAAELRKALVFQSINPIDAMTKFLGRVLVLDMPPGQHWFLLTTPIMMGAVTLVLLFGVAGPRLRLESTVGLRLRAWWTRRMQSTRPPRRRRKDALPPEAERQRDALPVPSAPMQRLRAVARARPGSAGAAAPTWWLVFIRELRDLWIGGKALNFTIAYTILVGGYAYWQARDSAVSLVPPKEMVFELLKFSMMASVFMGLILGADSLSGERERSTLESLLLTPTRRMQLIVGKFLAAASMWPAAAIVMIPFTYSLAQGDEVFGQTLLWGGIVGSALVPAFTALGMFVSFWCANNKSSMFASLSLYLIFLLPTQLQGRAQGGFMGLLFQALNPMAGTKHFLATILVNNRSVGEFSSFLVSTGVFLVAMVVLLFWYAGPSLRLEAGRATRRPKRFALAALVILCLYGLGGASTARASQTAQSPAAGAQIVDAPLHVSIDMSDTVVRAGTPLVFNTVVVNRSAEASHPMIVAMNIINLSKTGEVVDPEDWSPQRTQYVEPLAPGQSANLAWRVNCILDGDFMVYLVAIPHPGKPDATSVPAVSPGIHVTVTRYTKLNPGGVLPFAIGGPLVLALVIFLVYRHRRKQIDEGGSA
jgi:ABC-type transport system involved in multi-copper enzyme maturation permease subunit